MALGAALLISLADAAGAAGVGQKCDGFAGIACDPGLFCDHKPHECRLLEAMGTCVQIQLLCAESGQSQPTQVCGCNGTTYWNDCERIRAMAQKNHDGPCK
jgi:hypothetical protein